MTRQEAIDLHRKLADLHRIMRSNAALDIIADAEALVITLLDEQVRYLEGIDDQRWQQLIEE